jgi:hypothetical protein
MIATATPRRRTNHCAASKVALIGIEPCPSARSAAKSTMNASPPVANAMPKHAAPSANATPISTTRTPNRSANRLTTITIAALTPVPIAYRPEITDRESPVSSIIGSKNTEKTYDCPGPDENATSAPTKITAHP